MKLHITPGSPYARMARIVVIEKGLQDRVEVVLAKTRTAGSPYYTINPSGRVPFLERDNGPGYEDSPLICLYLDGLDGKPSLHPDDSPQGWEMRRLEAMARSMLDGLSVWGREIIYRPEGMRSEPIMAHEAARALRMVDTFEKEDRPPGADRPAQHRADHARLRARRSDRAGGLRSGMARIPPASRRLGGKDRRTSVLHRDTAAAAEAALTTAASCNPDGVK